MSDLIPGEGKRMEAAGFERLDGERAAAIEAERRTRGVCVQCGHTAEAHDTNSYSCDRCPCEEFRP